MLNTDAVTLTANLIVLVRSFDLKVVLSSVETPVGLGVMPVEVVAVPIGVWYVNTDRSDVILVVFATVSVGVTISALTKQFANPRDYRKTFSTERVRLSP